MFAKEKKQLGEEDISSEIQLKVRMEKILNSIEVRLVIAILAEYIDKFAIMGGKLPKVDALFSMKRIYERARQPCRGFKKEPVVDELIFHKLKLSKELQQLQKVLTILKNGLKTEGSYISLILYNYAMDKIQKEEEHLEEMYKGLYTGEETVISANRQRAQTFENEIFQLEKKGIFLKEMREELDYKAKGLKLYSSHHQKARVEQNNIRIELREKELKQKLSDTFKAIQDEKKSHELIVKYLERKNKRLDDSVEYWSRTYVNDIEHMEHMLTKLETEIIDQRHAMSSLLNEFLSREQEINNFLEEKAERDRLQQIEDLKNQAATKIQAWWRGCMVRWELGSYSSDLGKRRKRKLKKK